MARRRLRPLKQEVHNATLKLFCCHAGYYRRKAGPSGLSSASRANIIGQFGYLYDLALLARASTDTARIIVSHYLRL